MANITNIKVILAAIDKVEIIDVVDDTRQHAGTRINGWFRATGRDETTTVFAKASGRFGQIEFSVTKTETVKYRHDDDENVVSETSIGTGYIVYSAGVLGLDQAQALLTQAGFKFYNQKELS